MGELGEHNILAYYKSPKGKKGQKGKKRPKRKKGEKRPKREKKGQKSKIKLTILSFIITIYRQDH